MRAALLAVAGIVLCAAGLAGCGDDEPALSAEEFRRRGNAICLAGDAELEQAGEALFGDDVGALPEPQAIATFFTDKAIPIARKKLDQLEQLDPPERDRETLEEMIAAGREATEHVEEGLEEDPEQFLNETGPDPFDDFDELARDLGLDDCAGKD